LLDEEELFLLDDEEARMMFGGHPGPVTEERECAAGDEPTDEADTEDFEE
jgi:hypothetical protein